MLLSSTNGGACLNGTVSCLDLRELNECPVFLMLLCVSSLKSRSMSDTEVCEMLYLPGFCRLFELIEGNVWTALHHLVCPSSSAVISVAQTSPVGHQMYVQRLSVTE